MKKFPTPTEVGYGLTPSLASALNLVKNNLDNNKFTFTPGYDTRQWIAEVKTFANESSWQLIEHVNDSTVTWEFKPLR